MKNLMPYGLSIIQLNTSISTTNQSTEHLDINY